MSARTQLPSFRRLRALVLGDLVADHYLHAEPARLSREAPVMILRHAREEYGAGGAANAARNLRALGARTRLLGAVGRDASGRALLELVEREGIDTSGVLGLERWSTPTKTRVIAAEPRRSPHQVLRIDREPSGRPEERRIAELDLRLLAQASALDLVLVSDYDYGWVGAQLARTLAALAAEGVCVVLDPRRGMERFRGLTALTPNLEELASFAGLRARELEERAALVEAARLALERCAPRYLLVTLGNRGMALFGEGQPRGGSFLDACGPEQVLDVSGAGDTAAAAFALALAARVPALAAMRLANAAASVVVMKSGTATCTPDELRLALRSRAQDARRAKTAARARARGKARA